MKIIGTVIISMITQILIIVLGIVRAEVVTEEIEQPRQLDTERCKSR